MPLTSKLPSGSKIGKTIRIRGMCSGQDGWGKEEKRYLEKFPFLPFQYFDSSFVLMEDKFTVFVNDEHLVDFTHRGNPDNISVLGIKGSVHILETEYLGSMYTMMEVESGLEKGDIFVLNGMVTENGNVFAVNFLNGQSVDGDIALHLNPRVQTREMVLNSRIGGTWQEEEKVTLPGEFSYGKPFQNKVETKKKKFKIDLARWGWCSLSINTQDKHRDYDQCPHSLPTIFNFNFLEISFNIRENNL
uniref:Galectin-8 n=1 Tax=Magallana gigas TaxID=29159 RepID=K1R580_MAGGI